MLLEQSWPYIVSKHYGVAYHNLAVCGSDWSNVAQRTLYWLPKLKPNIMVIKEPTLIRFNWFGIDEQRFISNSAERKYTGISLGAARDENPIRSTSMHTDKEILQCSTTTRYGKIVNPLIELLSIESNVLWARHAMLLLIVALCKHYACDLVTIPSHKLSNTLLDRKDTDVARDLEHYGVKENLFVSELCINKIDNKSFETIDV